MKLVLDDVEAARLASLLAGHEDPGVRSIAGRMAAPLALALAVEQARKEGFKITTNGTGACRIALDRMGSNLSEVQAYRLWRTLATRLPNAK